MIVDTLENLEKYKEVNPLFPKVVEFLKTHDLSSLEIGKIELQGSDLFIKVAQAKPKTKEQAKIEAHKNYLDIQIPVSNTEVMGYTPLKDCKEATAYNVEKDVLFFGGLADSYLTVKPGMFAIFFPQDGHAPGVTPDGLKKVIVKVRV